jgi:hypothetical protein
MRVSPVKFVVGATVLALGCVGQIPTGGSNSNNSTAGTGGSRNGTGGSGAGPGTGTGGAGGNVLVDPPPAACMNPTLARPRVWRLTKTQIRNTLMDVANFSPPTLDELPSETRLDGDFANQSGKLTIAPLVADQYFTIGGELGTQVVTKSADFLKCPVASLAGTCLGDFVKGFGQKMWRRPLTDVEVGKLTTLFNTTSAMAGGPSAALQTTVQALFMSPNFLYRTEVGTSTAAGTVTNLTDFELASALSYTLWDSVPDQALMDLAAQNKLHDKATLQAQAKRMWGMGRSQGALNSFFQQWLQTEDLPTATKDPMYSMYNDQVAADLLEEGRLFLNSVVFDQAGDKSFKTLFTAPYGFVNARTAPLYGLSNVVGTALVKTNLNVSQRRGLLTQAGFVSAHSDGDDTAIVSRGRYFRGDILCDRIPPPPDPKLAVFGPRSSDPNMTNRERLISHVQNPQCAACHDIFDPIGFALENYDPIGRYRTTDKGKMIDPSGTIPLDGKDVTFTNFIDLINQLSNNPALYTCFSTQYFSYATGRGFDELSSCERKSVTDEFVKSGYKVDTLVMSVINSPSFTARQN